MRKLKVVCKTSCFNALYGHGIWYKLWIHSWKLVKRFSKTIKINVGVEASSKVVVWLECFLKSFIECGPATALRAADMLAVMPVARFHKRKLAGQRSLSSSTFRGRTFSNSAMRFYAWTNHISSSSILNHLLSSFCLSIRQVPIGRVLSCCESHGFVFRGLVKWFLLQCSRHKVKVSFWRYEMFKKKYWCSRLNNFHENLKMHIMDCEKGMWLRMQTLLKTN